MPVVKIKNKRYVLQWPPEWDLRLLTIAIRFRKGCPHCSRCKHYAFCRVGGPFINWKRAEKEGFLQGIPKTISRKRLSQRVAALTRVLHDPVKREKIRELNKTRPPFKSSSCFEDRVKIFNKAVPDSIKEEAGYSPRTKWSEQQKRLLMHLTKKYRRGKISINWEMIMKDPLHKKLPNSDDLNALRHYYWCVAREKTPEQLERKRADALRYKKENYSKFRKNQDKRQIIVRNSVNEYLMSTLEKR